MFQSGSSIGVNTTAPPAAFHTMATAAPGAPTVVQTDDILGGLAVRGYGATGFSGGQGQVMFRAAEPWTDAAHGSCLSLTTTPLGSASWVERMRISPAGNVGIETTTPGQMLSVAGTIERTTGGFGFPDGSVQTMAAKSDTVNNSAFGYWSLRNNTTGSGNSAFGSQSLNGNSTWQYNTAVGFASLVATSTGQRNTGLGSTAGYYNAGGSYNTYIGDAAGPDAGHPTLSYATAIGAGAQMTQSNSLTLGAPAGDVAAVLVGIGTSAPNTTLQVVGDIRVGTSATNGCVKSFAGTALAGTCSSGARLKADIRPFEPVLGRVVQLRPVHFTWNVEQFPAYHFGAGLNSGLIAEEVEQVSPEMVAADERGYKMVNYSERSYLTLAAVRELDAKANALQAQNAGLKAETEALRAQLAALAERLARLEKRQ